MNVYLVGMPGSGKTAVGAALARRLGRRFVDLDAEVERAAGAGIPSIFAERGEEGFRALESEALTRTAAGPDAVVSCGGGIVLDDANRERLRATGVVVWLSAPLERLRERVVPGAGRPLVREPEDLDRLLAEREPLYREVAHHVVPAEDDPEATAAALEERLG